jgi:transposase
MVPDGTLAPVVAALQTMRGMALVNAVTLIAELGDLSPFANPRQLMAYLGLVPSEHSSGTSIKRGGLTKAGNSAARPPAADRGSLVLPLPGAGQPRVAAPAGEPAQADPRDRLEGAAAAVRAIRKLARTGKSANIVTAAIAREIDGLYLGRCPACPRGGGLTRRPA